MTDQIQQPGNGFTDSILFKASVIVIIMLVLLIPSGLIQNLISDREDSRQIEVSSISDKWAGKQLVQGPVLLLPYKKQVTETGADNKVVTRQVTGTYYLLPKTLHIKADIKTERFEKGIYDAIIYNSGLVISGDFDKPALAEQGINPDDIMYDKARLVFGITDFKGLKNNPVINIQGQDHNAEATANEHSPFEKALKVNFTLQKDQGFSFSYRLDLKGSNELNFLYTGKTTDVEVNSDWAHPDFVGRYQPDTRPLDNKGENYKWHMLDYNRPFPQQWVDNDTLLTTKKAKAEAVFGVKLQLPIDQYRKVMRTTKYSSLIILLTFVSLFLAEVIRKQRVHLFNYTLIGAAMIVYYILLLSFSEQVGYNYAYLISSGSTIALITLFTTSLLNNKNVARLFALILALFYGFIFIIIQLEELSLLFGSIALFAIVATLMYFSRKINWNKY